MDLRKQARAKRASPLITAQALTAPAKRRIKPSDMEVSVTVGVTGSDIDLSLLDTWHLFVEEHCERGIVSVERGGALSHLHLQSLMGLQGTSVLDVKKRIAVSLGWDVPGQRPAGGEICVKKLTNKGIHTFAGMVGYCLKDETEHHFAVRMKAITEDMMADGRKLHMLLGASVAKNVVELTTHNVLHRALQFNRYRSRHPLTNSFAGCLRQMLKSGSYIASPGWLSTRGLDKERAKSLWSTCINPSAVTAADIFNIFFWQEKNREQRYFEARHPTVRESSHDDDDADEDAEQTTMAEADTVADDETWQQQTRLPPYFIPLVETVLQCTETLSPIQPDS